MNLQDLKKPFDRDEIEWRVQSSGLKGDKVWAKIIPYLQARAVMDRFDEVCGPDFWEDQYRFETKGIMCGITIHGERSVTKWDGAEPTKVESFKGGLSDSFKRAAVKWGIGRYVYEWTWHFAEVSMTPQKGYEYAVHTSKDKKTKVKYYWKVPEGAWGKEKDERPCPEKPVKLENPGATISDETPMTSKDWPSTTYSIDNDSQLPKYAVGPGRITGHATDAISYATGYSSRNPNDPNSCVIGITDKEKEEGKFSDTRMPIDNDSQLPNYAEAIGAEKDKIVNPKWLVPLAELAAQKGINNDVISKQIMTAFGKEKSSELTTAEYYQLHKFIKTYEVGK